MTSVSAADFAFLIAESVLVEWPLLVALVLGLGVGFMVVWILTRSIRREARANAAELIEVARREAAVAAEAMKQKTEEEIMRRRAELELRARIAPRAEGG